MPESKKVQDNNIEKGNEKQPKELNVLDSNYPLLKEFREKAPGSYKHAQSLAGMIENVCAALEIDPYPLKIAAMYHDIGKMWNPDTVAILVANDFDINIIKIVSQHHGTCVLGSIVQKLDIKDENMLNEFRYKTQRPDSIESLILMLCDQIEATSRSIIGGSSAIADPYSIISDIYNKLHLDGQFDNVEILLGNLKLIQEALVTDVASSFHKRIEYKNKNAEGDVNDD